MPGAIRPLVVLIVTPMLDIGAADYGAVELTRILTEAGHRAIVMSRPGRLVTKLIGAGGEFIPLNVASNNPVVMAQNAAILLRLVREHECSAIHALGRSGAWSAFVAARLAHIPFLTSWHKGFREQNIFKHLYNGVMARGDRVLAASEQIAQLINDRHGTPWEKIKVVPCSIDLDRFNPSHVGQDRIDAIRKSWGVKSCTKVIVVAGRILRRKGHHIAVKAIKRLKETGLRDFSCVFVGEDHGHTRYNGELWDLVVSTGTMDVIRMAAPVGDMPAAYAAASVVISAAVQPEGIQRAILEAQAMARPVIVSELAAGTDVVLTTPAIPENRIAGLRVPVGDETALAAALLRMFSMPELERESLGLRGRDWVHAHFNAATVARQVLHVYGEVIDRKDDRPNVAVHVKKI